MMAEVYERQKGDNNLMIFNLPESNNDLNEVQALMREIVSKPVNIIGANRLGERNKNGYRSLKVQIADSQAVLTIIKNLSKLNRNPKVYISTDLTTRQHDYINKLKCDIEHRKSENEPDLIIKYVHGIPQIVKKHTKTNSLL